MVNGFSGLAMGGTLGAVTGGFFQGIKALTNGDNFWSGDAVAQGRNAFSFKNTPVNTNPAPATEPIPINNTGVDVPQPSNPVPDRLARVIPANIDPSTLAPRSQENVFVTASEDISGLNSSQLATKLGIDPSPSGFKVYEFSTPKVGISSPINYADPRFTGFGRTIGGAREFWIPNQSIPKGATIKVIP
jgi:hypothetical protein